MRFFSLLLLLGTWVVSHAFQQWTRRVNNLWRCRNAHNEASLGRSRPCRPRLVFSSSSSMRAAVPTIPDTSTATPPPSPEQVGLRGLYPPSCAYANGTLEVDDVHTIYFELHGRRGDDDDEPNNGNTDNVSPPPSSLRNALFLHGGPGSGCFPNHARFFDPAVYRVVLMDQRACGWSTPRGDVRQNTLMDIVHDCERLREYLGDIDRWDVVLGGSWGTTVAVAYAQEFPTRIRAMVLRGVCLLRPQEVDWLFSSQGGMAQANPELWKAFATAVDSPESHPRDALHAYYDRLLCDDPSIRLKAAKSWMTWEFSAFASSSSNANKSQEFYDKAYAPVAVGKNGAWQWQNGSGTLISREVLERMGIDNTTCDEGVAQLCQGLEGGNTLSVPQKFTRSPRSIEHQMSNNTTAREEISPEAAAFIPAQNILTCFYSVNDRYATNNIDLLDPERLKTVQHIPCIAVHGGLDRVCPLDTALELQRHWPGMELRVPTKSGHSMYDVAITNQLIRATDEFGSLAEE